MNKLLRNIIAAAAIMTTHGAYAQWTAIGSSTGISAGGSSYQHIVRDAGGNLYVAYYDSTVSKGTVMRYNGTSWSYAGGSAGVTGGTAYYSSLAVNSAHEVYYAYQDGASSNKLSVKQYTNGNWNNTWQNLSLSGAYFSSVKTGPPGYPYVVCRDLGTSGGNLSVKRFDGSSWVALGNTSFASTLPYYSTLVAGTNDTMYVSLVTALAQAEVYKIHAQASGTATWQLVGGTTFPTSSTVSIFQSMSSIAIDSSNRLYLAYVSSAAEGNKMKVKMYANGAWSSVGTDNFSPGTAKYVSIAVTPGGTPYVAFSDGNSSSKTTVMKYDGTQWVVLGSAGISAGTAIYNSLTLDASGNPIVAFTDGGYGGKTVVMHYQPACTTGDPAGATGSLGCVSFNYDGSTTTYTTVRAADGNIWLQQNLGSLHVAAAQTDSLAFGDVYQWGRWTDGHQHRNAATGTVPATNDPTGIGTGNANFFTGTPGWWNGGALTNTWAAATPAATAATDGCDPCKAMGTGWHLPTQQEWQTIVTNEAITSPATAYASNLKLTTGGNRNSSGNYDFAGTRGYYWSSTPSSTGGKYFYFSSAIANPSAGGLRGQGMSIRCMKKAGVDSVKLGVLNNALPEITTNAGTLQMTATVYPAAASQAVTWSITNGTGVATISTAGLVTAQANGIVWVKAVSVADTTKYDAMQVVISGQIVPIDSIVVKTQGNVQPVITTVGGGLQLEAMIYPATANQAVTWSITQGTGTATISTTGNITAVANGTVWAKAISVQDATMQDSLLVTISNQSSSVAGAVYNDLFVLYPNPVTDVLQVILPEPERSFTATVFSTDGRIIMQQQYNSNKGYIHVQELPAGVYMLRVSTANAISNKTFLKL